MRTKREIEAERALRICLIVAVPSRTVRPLAHSERLLHKLRALYARPRVAQTRYGCRIGISLPLQVFVPRTTGSPVPREQDHPQLFSGLVPLEDGFRGLSPAGRRAATTITPDSIIVRYAPIESRCIMIPST